MIRVDAVWLAVQPLDMRLGTEAALARVVGVFGAATIVFGFTRNFGVAFGALVVLSGADSISVFIRSTLVPLVTPNEVRGRVGAVENVFIGASNELGAFESGLLGQALGAGPAIVAGGAATIAVVLIWPMLFPAIRRLDHFPFHHSFAASTGTAVPAAADDYALAAGPGATATPPSGAVTPSRPRIASAARSTSWSPTPEAPRRAFPPPPRSTTIAPPSSSTPCPPSHWCTP